MAVTVLVNGMPCESVSVRDRGFAFGDGVFRTLRVMAGRPLNWKRHYARLVDDCRMLGLTLPDERTLLGELAQVAKADATAKVTITRGAATRGYSVPETAEPTRVIAAFAPPAYSPSLARDGVRVRRCRLVLSEQPRLAGAKTLNRLENVLARNEWTDDSIAEGLLVDAAGRLIGGTMTNVFVVRGDRIATPGLSRCGVVGAQRERVRGMLQGACEVRDIAFDELRGADEVFLTNSLIGVWSVASLDDWRREPGPRARQLRTLIEEEDAKGL